MKYFTPELLLRCRIPGDEGDTAAMEWMEAIEKYNAYLKGVFDRGNVPSYLRDEIEKMPALHDWKVLSFGQGAKSQVISFYLECSVRNIDLLYSPNEEEEALEQGVIAIQHQGFDKTSARYWLYDEFSLDPEKKEFVHSILFSDGLELQIAFDDFFWESLLPIEAELH